MRTGKKKLIQISYLLCNFVFVLDYKNLRLTTLRLTLWNIMIVQSQHKLLGSKLYIVIYVVLIITIQRTI